MMLNKKVQLNSVDKFNTNKKNCIIFALLLSCQPNAPGQSDNSESALNGYVAKIFASFLKKDEWVKPLASDKLKDFSRNMIHHLKDYGVRKEIRKAAFQKSLLTALSKEELPSDQLHSVLRQLAQSDQCGGALCREVFGFGPDEVSEVMDDTQILAEKMLSTEDLADNPGRRVQGEKILRSLRPSTVGKKLNALSSDLKRVTGRTEELEGACILPLLQAFGLRTNPPKTSGPLTQGLGPLTKNMAPIDFRRSGGEKFQGQLGACHLFATTALLSHSQFDEIKTARSLDIERTFVEIWAHSLGKNINDAVLLELEFLDRLNKVRRDHLSKALREGLPQDKAFNRFVSDSKYFFWFYKQTGTIEPDFQYIRDHGAPIRDQETGALTVETLEKLAETIALTRLRIMEAETFGGNLALSREQRVEKIRAAFQPVFDLAEDSMSLNRTSVKDELKSFQVISRQVSENDVRKDMGQFLSDLKSHGPLYISANGHASLVVGFDPKKKEFLVRDSDDPLTRDYAPMDADELLENFQSYAFLEKVGS